ncbi:MAG: CoA ester lyase [Donghicola eburneus]|nr:CoA ester lyase [Donghicola eburneus]MCI5042380.1 CoA ester lyase [Donghicola eburneus]
MWRSLLFVPVLNDRLVEGAARRGADAVVLDLEAAVPRERKEEARSCLAGVVAGPKSDRLDVAVRVNPLSAEGVEDIAAALEAGADLIVLPQATRATAKQAADLVGATPLIPLIESPRGVIDALAIAEAASNVVGLGLGIEDYATEMGAPPTPELLVPAAFQVIQAARAAGCEPLAIPDTVADYTDLTRFEAAALRARALGASGGFAIHPGQIEVLNRVFLPSDEDIRAAQEVIALAETAHQTGDAIASRNGQMIDAPIVARARAVLALGRRYADQSAP